MLIELILIGLGLALLMKGADFLVDGSSRIAKKFNIPEIVIRINYCSNRYIFNRTGYKRRFSVQRFI